MLSEAIIASSLAFGVSASNDLGENAGLIGIGQVQAHSVRLEAFYDTSDKTASGGGFRTGVDLDVLPRISDSFRLIAGVGRHYRDGGDWVANSTWLRGGFRYDAAQILVAHDATGPHSEWQIEERARLPKSPFFELRIGFESFVDLPTHERKTGAYWIFVVGIGSNLR